MRRVIHDVRKGIKRSLLEVTHTMTHTHKRRKHIQNTHNHSDCAVLLYHREELKQSTVSGAGVTTVAMVLAW